MYALAFFFFIDNIGWYRANYYWNYTGVLAHGVYLFDIRIVVPFKL